jgi:TetR/AcrR family transcriptional regulator
MPVKRSPRRKSADKRSSLDKSNTQRRIGAVSSETRAVLLDAAERLMRKEGYAAVTSRRLAAKAGLTHQLVHYYFRTMDDLFLALWRRYADKILVRQAQALASSQPLRALWEHSSDAWDTSLYIEFMALANHRKAIRSELAQTGERYRTMQIGALSRIVKDLDLGTAAVKSSQALLMLVVSVPRILVMEAQLGMSGGHPGIREFAEHWLQKLEGPRVPRRTALPRQTARSGYSDK